MGDSEMRFKQGDESGNGSMGYHSSAMTLMPLLAKPDPFFSAADWDPIVSSNNGFPNLPYCSLAMENQGMNSFARYPSASGSSYFEMEPNQIAHNRFPSKETGSDEPIAASFNRKRRKSEGESESNPSLNWNKKAVEEHQSDAAKDQSSKRSDFEPNIGANSQGKQPAKENTDKENSQSGEAPKENYLHMRARRGQATNSHSLAERVRREKISERMRLLQELVPGCNKITGKAVMLDEIINYVQSLQQQVEFLSMKLATVNPELNFDIERIMSKDIFSSRGGNAAVLGFSPGMSHSHHPYGLLQGTIPNISSTNQQFIPLPQTALDNELQGLYQMGLVSSSTMNGLAQNERLKPEI